MKFEDIKVGDTVYLHKSPEDKYKCLSAKVTKVTPKFFDANNRRFYKNSGVRRGNNASLGFFEYAYDYLLLGSG